MTKKRSKNYGSLLTVLTMCVLTGCVKESPAVPPSSAIYQPRILSIPAGTPVQTREGIYTPTHDEVWHSQAAYTALETELIDAAAVIQQLRATK